MSGQTLKLGAQNWTSEVEAAALPVLVDFWAEWCPPCRQIAPSVDALATRFQGQVKVGKLDVDAEPELAARFGIRSIPTLLVLSGGQVVGQKVGACAPAELERFLLEHIPVAATPR